MARKGTAMKKQNTCTKRVELRGEVRAADLDRRQFSLRLDDGTKIVAEFTTEQESVITEALRGHADRRLRLIVSAEVVDAGRIKQIDSVESLAIEPAQLLTPDLSSKPIWEVAVEIGANVPEEEWAAVPTDLAKNLHHYLYRSPKENDE